MKKIGVLSDTHGVLPPQVFTFFEPCDELWHAGDLGPGVLERLRDFRPLRAVYGNIDDWALRRELPEYDLFDCEGLRVLMTHMGGRPGRYPARMRQLMESERPDIYVCGHSHILKVMFDPDMNFLHINPGAAGRQGFHQTCTLVRFDIDPDPCRAEVLDFPKEGGRKN